MLDRLMRFFGVSKGPEVHKAEAYVMRMEFSGRHRLAEIIPTEKLPALIADIYREVGESIRICNGKVTAIDIGDMLAFIPKRNAPNESLSVCKCALQCVERVTVQLKPYLQTEEIGLCVGISSGPVVLSDEEGRLMALGEPVHFAAILLHLAMKKGLRVLVAKAVLEGVDSEGKLMVTKHTMESSPEQQAAEIEAWEVSGTST